MSSSSQAQMPPGCPKPWSKDSICKEKPEARAHDLPPRGTLIRRAVSDSDALSKALLEDSIPGLASDVDEDDIVGLTGLDSTLVYGPNSPRKKGASFSDYALVSALSESISQNSQQPVGEPARARTVKRNTWQHSRDRKVQYIAELERTINSLQALNTNLEVRLITQNQQCVALSMENNNLMQRLATLEDQIFIKEGQYQLLKEENERLKIAFLNATPPEATRSPINWQMFDMEKLSLS